MAVFQRYVSVDWSGAGMEHERVDLGVVAAVRGDAAEPIWPPCYPRVRKWGRADCRAWLSGILSPNQPRTIVALDFGLGLPWGSDQGMFGYSGWRAMLHALAESYARYGTARRVAEAINENPRFGGHGPFRFNENRTDFRFYLRNEVAYYRLVETAVPQAMSQWYVGSGGQVGSSTITGLATIQDLIVQREAERVRFRVWPQEC